MKNNIYGFAIILILISCSKFPTSSEIKDIDFSWQTSPRGVLQMKSQIKSYVNTWGFSFSGEKVDNISLFTYREILYFDHKVMAPLQVMFVYSSETDIVENINIISMGDSLSIARKELNSALIQLLIPNIPANYIINLFKGRIVVYRKDTFIYKLQFNNNIINVTISD